MPEKRPPSTGESPDEQELLDGVLRWDVPDHWPETYPPWTYDRLPHPNEVDGRSEGQGEWLEAQTAYAGIRWDYPCIAVQDSIWGFEIDVILACPINIRDEYDVRYPRVVIECRDWTDDYPITENDVWRVTCLATAARCRPAIAHTQPVKPRAREAMEKWNVIDLTLEDVLHASEIPRYEEWTLTDPVDGSALGPARRELPPILDELTKADHNPRSGPSYSS